MRPKSAYRIPEPRPPGWRVSLALAAVLAGLLVIGSSGPQLRAQSDDEAHKKQREEHRREMQRLAQSVAVFEIIRTERTESKRLREPLMRYSDIAREIYDSTLWAWGERGRPVALMKWNITRRHRVGHTGSTDWCRCRRTESPPSGRRAGSGRRRNRD